MTGIDVIAPRSRRRAGQRKSEVLEAAATVIAQRGADATRFSDVSQASGVPVSTLQYYFGSREDLLIAAFRHASETELAALREELARLADPWLRLVRIVDAALAGYLPDESRGGHLWIESWRFGMRDQEMRVDVLRDYAAWRGLIADAIRAGAASGADSGAGLFPAAGDPERAAVLILSLLDGLGMPLALADPAVGPEPARELVLVAVGRLLGYQS
jgi:AcrR family transcriptional regulator